MLRSRRWWLMAVSAAVGFICGAVVLIKAAKFWIYGADRSADPAQIPPPLYGIVFSVLLVAGAVLAFWKRHPFVLMAGWALYLGGLLYEASFVFIPSVRMSYGLPAPGLGTVVAVLAWCAFPVAGMLLPLPAWLAERPRAS